MTRIKSRILNLRSVRFQPMSHGERFGFKVAPMGARLGSRKLGFNVTAVPPGRRSWPYHAHHGNEEMFFVLEGRGTIRIAGVSHPLRKGDFVSLPPGRKSAHQIVNTSRAELRYLAVSTMEAPDVAEYPDSGKLGIFAGAPPGRAPSGEAPRAYLRAADAVGYWEGEERAGSAPGPGRSLRRGGRRAGGRRRP